MAQLVSIGNSQGVRIPKILIKQARLENKELSFKVVDNGLLITPSKKARANWLAQCEAIINTSGHEPLDSEWLDASLLDEVQEW